jgi:hypothetical protein
MLLECIDVVSTQELMLSSGLRPTCFQNEWEILVLHITRDMGYLSVPLPTD